MSSQPTNTLVDKGGEFNLTTIQAVKKLPSLRTIFHHGCHLSHSGNTAIVKTIPVIFEEWHEKYPELQTVRRAYDVALENNIKLGNDKWTCLYGDVSMWAS